MAESYRVIGYGAERGAEPIVDNVIVDETDEGPEFYAFQVLHVSGVVCCAVWREGHNEPPVAVRCYPDVDLHDVLIVAA